MLVPILQRVNVPTPAAGNVYFFMDVDNGNALTYKTVDCFFYVIGSGTQNSGCGGCNDCICELVEKILTAASCTLEKGMMTPAEYQELVTNLNYFSSTVPQEDGSCSSSITTTRPLSIDLQLSHVSCNGGSDGTAQATVTGGEGPYTLNWGIGVDPGVLTAGNYTLQVTDADGNTAAQTFTINQPTAILISGNITGVSPAAAIDVTVTGGTPGYTYSWDDGPTTQDRTGLSSGEYILTVTDANGCTAQENFIIP